MASQLRIPGTGQCSEAPLAEEVARLRRHWTERTSALLAVETAAQACMARFGSWDDRPLSQADAARVGAYFRAVVRRRVLSGHDESSRDARSALVARSIEADLVRGGWAPERAAVEGRRVVGLSATTRGVA